MSSSFIKTTLRNLYREKIYSVINISGLSLAIACCLILGLYLRSELTYDQHNTKHRQIFRVENEYNVNGKIETFAITSQLLGPILTEEYAEVKGFVRFLVINRKVLLRSEEKAFYWENTAFANKNVFEIFDHDFIYGDPNTAKTERFVAVSESFSRKYWGDENPIGKTITSEGNPAKITHVFADLPENSHLKYDVLYSDNIPLLADLKDANARRQRLMSRPQHYTYLLMPEDYDTRNFKKISDSFFKRHMEEMLKVYKITWRAWLQPLTDIHYNSDVGYDEPTGNKHYLYGFSAVAIFILLVACINYMNLATARAARRAKEVGMRKILGSGRTRLIFQFIGEAIFFSLIAMLLGYVLVEVTLTLTPINELLDTSLKMDLCHEPELLVWMLIFSLALALMSGIYPAFYLSSIAPLTALVGSTKTGKGSIRLREMLVLIQFIISVTVIACTLLMALQMRYLSNKPLGFNKENRLVITLRTADVIDKVPTIKKELLKNSSVLGVSLCQRAVGTINDSLIGAQIDNIDGVPEVILVNSTSIGNDFIEVMGMEIIEGRDFSKRLITDVGVSYIINETMVKKMGWDQPLGKNIQSNDGSGKVIGVVKDFHYDSLRSNVESFVFRRFSGTQNVSARNRNNMILYLVVNLAGEEIFHTMDFIEEKLAEFDPKHPFEFEFLDDSLNKLYQNEQRLMTLIGIFAAICIFISCMGLFGLAAFTTEQRTKEIGIRKVLGASSWQIITMLARNILYLVLGGAVIASLIAYYVMDEWWLTDFAYRTDIDLWAFLMPAAVAASVAFITIALQSFKTAQANPVDALRYE